MYYLTLQVFRSPKSISLGWNQGVSRSGRSWRQSGRIRVSSVELLEAVHIPLLVASSSIFKASRLTFWNLSLTLNSVSLSSCPSLTPPLLPPTYKELHDYFGPPQIIWDNFPISESLMSSHPQKLLLLRNLYRFWKLGCGHLGWGAIIQATPVPNVIVGPRQCACCD